MFLARSHGYLQDNPHTSLYCFCESNSEDQRIFNMISMYRYYNKGR